MEIGTAVHIAERASKRLLIRGGLGLDARTVNIEMNARAVVMVQPAECFEQKQRALERIDLTEISETPASLPRPERARWKQAPRGLPILDEVNQAPRQSPLDVTLGDEPTRCDEEIDVRKHRFQVTLTQEEIAR